MSHVVLPPDGAPIDVTSTGETYYRTWVDRSLGNVLRVFIPSDLLVEDAPRPGDAIEVCWYSPRGRHRLVMRYTNRRVDGGSQWDLEVAGEPLTVQDRRFVRGPGGVPVVLRTRPASAGALESDATEKPRTVRGLCVDLSEGGMRVRLDAGQEPVDGEVRLDVVLDGEPVRLDATVLRTFPDRDGRLTEQVLVYSPPEAVAATLRRYVLAGQRRARRDA